MKISRQEISGAIMLAGAVTGILVFLLGEGTPCRYLKVLCPPDSTPAPVDSAPSASIPHFRPDIELTGRVPWPQHIEAGGVPLELERHLRLLPGAGRQIRSVAMDGAGKWLILHDSGSISVGAPPDLLAYLDTLRSRERSALQVAFAPQGDGWAVLDDSGHLEDRGTLGLPRAILAEAFRGFGIAPEAWALLRSGRGSHFNGIVPERLQALLRDDPVAPLRTLAMSADRFVAVPHSGPCAYENLPQKLVTQLALLCPDGHLRVVALTPHGAGWVIVADTDATPGTAVARR